MMRSSLRFRKPVAMRSGTCGGQKHQASPSFHTVTLRRSFSCPSWSVSKYLRTWNHPESLPVDLKWFKACFPEHFIVCIFKPPFPDGLISSVQHPYQWRTQRALKDAVQVVKLILHCIQLANPTLTNKTFWWISRSCTFIPVGSWILSESFRRRKFDALLVIWICPTMACSFHNPLVRLIMVHHHIPHISLSCLKSPFWGYLLAAPAWTNRTVASTWRLVMGEHPNCASGNWMGKILQEA